MYHRPARVLIALAAVLLGFLGPLAPTTQAAETSVSSARLPDRTLFRVKMELGAVDLAREWLDAGLPPDFMGDRIGTGLMIAAWEGNLPLMTLFAERGAALDQTNALGETALMHAAWKGRREAVRWLLDRGAKVELQSGQLAWTALHYAAFAGHREVAQLLLERGADINARSPNGSSVLMMAIYEGHQDMARWLVDRGANPAIRNEKGDAALDWAMKFNHIEIARIVATTREEFVAAASRPKTDWAPPQKSEPAPRDLEELLGIRAILAERKLSLDRIDRQIAALRAKYARESLKREAPPPAAAVLEISAERKAPGKQRTRIVK